MSFPDCLVGSGSSLMTCSTAAWARKTIYSASARISWISVCETSLTPEVLDEFSSSSELGGFAKKNRQRLRDFFCFFFAENWMYKSWGLFDIAASVQRDRHAGYRRSVWGQVSQGLDIFISIERCSIAEVRQ